MGKGIEDRSAGDSRRDRRFGFTLLVRVEGGREAGRTPWEEVTTTRDASAGGVSFVVGHPVAVGEVIRLRVLPPLPEALKQFELTEPSSPAYAVVRTNTVEAGARRVGVKFCSDGDVEELMPAALPAPPAGTDERRRSERFVSCVNFVVKQADEWGAILTEALTVAENISRGGAQLLAPIPVSPGDVIFLREAGGEFETRAEVTNASTDEEGLRRLHVKFLDGRSPGHLVPAEP